MVGQVEDDASILTGTTDVCTNLDLLLAARKAEPRAQLIYKPHPDVEAGFRKGHVPEHLVAALDAHLVSRSDPAALIQSVDTVWTMTSLLGFEALLRGKPVTTLGAPFYAGWGLTQDLGVLPQRRRATPDILGLIHAALIDYPRYFDPVTRRACPVEVVVDRLCADRRSSPHLLSPLQHLRGWVRKLGHQPSGRLHRCTTSSPTRRNSAS